MSATQAKYERLLQDLRADLRPQRARGEGRGIFMVLGHFVVGVAAGVWLFALLYGMTDEFHQQFVPGRFSSLMDIAADVAGAVIAVWFRNKRSNHTT